MIKIISLGGSGEDSRSCFLVQSENLSVLFDCGVRREISDVSRVYPLLTKEIAENLDAVIISHAHEDHSAALPYLYALGYQGAVYTSDETITLIPSYLRKWAQYVKSNNGLLPFDEEIIYQIPFRNITVCPIDLSYGRDGHMIGGLWYNFEMDGYSILYTGDLTFNSLLWKADPLPQADIVILEGAYADQHLNQDTQYKMLAEKAREVTSNGGKLLLPVPANGRGIDMFVYLSQFGLPIFIEENIVQNTEKLTQKRFWAKDFEVPQDCYTLVTDENRAAILQSGQPGVYFFSDGMLTSAVSKQYFESEKYNSSSKIIISGHTALGTLGDLLQNEIFRSENKIKVSVEKLTIKVHNDYDDVLRLVDQVKPKYIMLFHCNKKACTSLIEKLSETTDAVIVCDVNKPIIIAER